jgi:hypothetical protein
MLRFPSEYSVSFSGLTGTQNTLQTTKRVVYITAGTGTVTFI